MSISIINQQDGKECASLHLAAAAGLATQVRLLLDDKADLLAENNQGRVPLQLAAENGHIEVVREFLRPPFTVEKPSTVRRQLVITAPQIPFSQDVIIVDYG